MAVDQVGCQHLRKRTSLPLIEKSQSFTHYYNYAMKQGIHAALKLRQKSCYPIHGYSVRDSWLEYQVLCSYTTHFVSMCQCMATSSTALQAQNDYIHCILPF